jgi:hypothetical protein
MTFSLDTTVTTGAPGGREEAMPPRFEKREMPTGGENLWRCHDCHRLLHHDEVVKVPVQANFRDLPASTIRYEGWVVCPVDAARRGIT